MSDPPPPRSLPAWLTANRVKGTTRLPFGAWHDRPEFTQAAAGFEALGARAFTRHVKSGDEDPWDRGVWQQLIDEADGRKLKIVGYYWHMAEASLADTPGWVCRKHDGTKIKGDRGLHLDITGDFGGVVLERLLELAKMGIDGLQFDERHLPPGGAWGSALEDAWTAEKGVPAPAPHASSELYRQFLDFKAKRIEDTFAHWRETVQAARPDVVFIVSTTTIPGLTDREMTTRLARVSDSAKNEYRLALSDALTKRVFVKHPGLAPSDHVRQAVGWTVLRDSAEGRPPQIWVSGVPNVAHARAAAGSLLTFGCIANMDVDEQSLLGTVPPAPGKTPLNALEAAFALGRDASPHLAAAQPLRWAAVHFAEQARNARGRNHRTAWEHVLWPMVGAFQVLSEDGLPVGVVNDHQLEQDELAGYRVLVLPDPHRLTTAQAAAVAAFRARDGVVIENDPSWVWGDAAGREAAFAALRAAFQPHLDTAPLRVTGGPRGRYAVAYRNGPRLVVAVTNDFEWVQITKRNKPAAEINDPPPRAGGVRVSWRKGHKLPEPSGSSPVPGLRAVDVVNRKVLTVKSSSAGYRVDLPPFRTMALLVVSRSRIPLGPHEPAPGPADKV